MNLFMKLDILPMETPRILLVPDSLGSRTFLAFYSEKARFYQKILFFFTSSSALVSFVLNLPMSSPIRSVAPSGGFSTSFFFLPFLFLSSFVYLTSLSSLIYETELSEGLTDDGLITDEVGVCDWDWDWLMLEDDWLLEAEGCWDVELFKDEVLFSFDLSLIDELEESCSAQVGFLLKLDAVVCSIGFVASFPIKLLTLGWPQTCQFLFVAANALFCFPAGLTLISPLTSCDTRDKSTAWLSGFFISIWKLLANSTLFMLWLSRLISFLNTLRVYLNLKLYRNSWIRSMHSEVSGYFLSLGRMGCSYWKPSCFLFWLLYFSTRFSTSVLSLDWTYLNRPEA